MINMPACAVNTICQNKSYATHIYCKTFSILKEGCIDMSLVACNDYMCMCAQNATVVQQCNTDILPLPTSAETLGFIDTICTSMPMSDCDRCPIPRSLANCELLPVYSDLCKTVPDMDECIKWNEICALVPSWPLCPEGGCDRAIMGMYFHFGVFDFVLFEEWLPCTTPAFIGTWIIIFALSILYELLKVFRSRCENNWQGKTQDSINNEKTEKAKLLPKPLSFRLGVDLPRAILHTLEVALGLLLMLVAMTFNVALFLAICLGAFAGSVCSHRFATQR